MKWYERDCDAALVGMRELSDVAYRGYNVLLDVLYSRNGDVADDDRLIAKHIGWRPQRWRKAKAELIEKGKVWITSEGKLMAKRVEKTLKKAGNFSSLQSDRANLRWKNKGASMPTREGMPPHTQREEELSSRESSSSLSQILDRAAGANARELASLADGSLAPSPPASPPLTPNPTLPPRPIGAGMSPDMGDKYREPPRPKPPEHQHPLQNLDELLAQQQTIRKRGPFT